MYGTKPAASGSTGFPARLAARRSEDQEGEGQMTPSAAQVGGVSQPAAGRQALDALAAQLRPVADELTWYVHRGDGDTALRLLERLSPLGLQALVIALAAARKPRWVLKDDGDVDEVAVRRAAAGEPIQLTRGERAAAARRIVAAGGGPSQLAARLHLNGTTARLLYERVSGRPGSEPGEENHAGKPAGAGAADRQAS